MRRRKSDSLVYTVALNFCFAMIVLVPCLSGLVPAREHVSLLACLPSSNGSHSSHGTSRHAPAIGTLRKIKLPLHCRLLIVSVPQLCFVRIPPLFSLRLIPLHDPFGRLLSQFLRQLGILLQLGQSVLFGDLETFLESGTSFDSLDPGGEEREFGEIDSGPVSCSDPA